MFLYLVGSTHWELGQVSFNIVPTLLFAHCICGVAQAPTMSQIPDRSKPRRLSVNRDTGYKIIITIKNL